MFRYIMRDSVTLTEVLTLLIEESFFMNLSRYLTGIAVTFGLSTLAIAAPVTFNFGSNPAACYTPSAFSGCTTVANLTTPGVGSGGKSYTVSGETVRVYGEVGGSVVAAPNDGGPGAFTGGLDLFSVSASDGLDNATGIAPTSSPTPGNFTGQNGITETDILLLQLDSSIALNSSISLLMQAGVNGDTFNVYKLDGSVVPTGVGSGGANPMTELAPSGIAVDVAGNRTPSTPQFTFTKTTSGTEWIAIQADCHYLLLDSLTATPGGSTSSTPEPRFYGLLLAGLLGVAGTIYRKRQATA
jgi:hypothetical protein